MLSHRFPTIKPRAAHCSCTLRTGWVCIMGLYLCHSEFPPTTQTDGGQDGLGCPSLSKYGRHSCLDSWMILFKLMKCGTLSITWSPSIQEPIYVGTTNIQHYLMSFPSSLSFIWNIFTTLSFLSQSSSLHSMVSVSNTWQATIRPIMVQL